MRSTSYSTVLKGPPLTVLMLLLAAAPKAAGQSTIDSNQRFAYSGNTGWVDARPDATSGVVVGETFLAGHAYGANFGWMHLGDGTPGNGHTYTNASASDFGVNRDVFGNLFGLAYSANLGWLSFDWAGIGDPNRPRIDGFGDFSGYAYSANAGWFLLGTGSLATHSFAPDDTDADGMSDSWELLHFGNLTKAGIGTDFDGDGQSDAAEASAGTDPTDNKSYLRVLNHTYNSGVTQVTITFTSNPVRLYRIERSATLAGAWIDSPLGLILADEGTTTTRSFSFPASTQNFFRVITSNPLAP